MTKKSTHSLAISGARKICGYANCFQPYDCGHSNKRLGIVSRTGSELVCPLAKYNVTPDPRPAWERPAGDTRVTSEEIWALCEECSHCEIVERNGELILTRKDFYTACLDCPVKAIEDSISECEAEAWMS